MQQTPFNKRIHKTEHSVRLSRAQDFNTRNTQCN